MSPEPSAETAAKPASPTGAPAGVEILLVGPRESSILRQLAQSLERDGWPAVRTSLGDVATRVSSRRRAVVVVRTSDAAVALGVLDELEPKRHSAPVIVVVDRADLGERHCLMQAGAVHYFEAGEDPGRIVQGVEWAARALAP